MEDNLNLKKSEVVPAEIVDVDRVFVCLFEDFIYLPKTLACLYNDECLSLPSCLL